MGKYKNAIKCAEIKKLADNKQFQSALDLLETIDIEYIKSTADLNTFVEVYINTEKYEEAKEILLKIYEKSPTRRTVYQLLVISIKLENIEEAEQYYTEYKEIAPYDSELYIMRYLIDKAKKADRITLIHTLEELKKADYIEEWAYELAKLYHKAGMKKECIKECNDIVLWFGNGVIVEKARMLRDYYLGTASIPVGEVRKRLKKETVFNEKLAEEVVKAVHEKYALQESKGEEDTKEETKDTLKEDSEKLKNLEEKELKDIFGNFIDISLINKKLEEIFQEIRKKEEKRVFLIIGNKKSGKSTLAKMIVKTYYKKGLTKTSKVAKIKAEKLNKISLKERKEKLKNTCLLVEDVKEMTIYTLEDLLTIIKELDKDFLLILEENKKEQESFLENYFIQQKEFAHVIKLPEYSKEDLYNFACHYMKNWGYYFAEEAKEGVEQIIDNIILQYKQEEQLEYLIKIMEMVRKNMEIKNEKKCFIIYLEDLITDKI